jgi:hypothetical protein
LLDPRCQDSTWLGYLGGEDAGSENDGQVLGGHLVGVAGCRHRREMAAQKGEAGDVLTQGEKNEFGHKKTLQPTEEVPLLFRSVVNPDTGLDPDSM